MTIETKLIKEFKNEIERLYLLSKTINTNGTKYESMIEEPKSQNARTYANEVEKYDKPYLYYHHQDGFYYAEIRKIRNKTYELKTNFECNIKEMEENTFEQKKIYGNNIEFRYKNDEYEKTIKNFRIAIENLQKRIKAMENNEFIY